MDEAYRHAAELIRNAKRIVAFTGSGISAESGIPTYRGAGGIWSEYDPDKYANIDYFMHDPTYYWSFFRDVRYDKLVKSEPNRAHTALAELEKDRALTDVITQNIDGLHQAAGSGRVIELHGNTRIIICLDCGAEYHYEDVRRQVEKEMPPKCTKCSGLLKPKVVFFGEGLPADALQGAAEASGSCDLFIVVGSSLVVYPAAGFPVMAKQNGAKLIVINLGETGMEGIEDVRIDEKATVAFDSIMSQLKSA